MTDDERDQLEDRAASLTGLARTAWVGTTISSLYVWLTLASLRDIDLFLGQRTFRLPVIETEIAPSGFFVFAPILLFSVFLYFQLMLFQLFQCYCRLRKASDSDQALWDSVPPWFLTVLVEAPDKAQDSGAAGCGSPRRKQMEFRRLAFHLAWFFAYGFTPLTVFVMSYRYLRAHEIIPTAFHAAVSAAIIMVALAFWAARCECCGFKPGVLGRILQMPDAIRRERVIRMSLTTLILGLLLFAGAETLKSSPVQMNQPFRFLSPHAQLYRAELSKKPEDWYSHYQSDRDEEIALLRKCIEVDHSEDCDLAFKAMGELDEELRNRVRDRDEILRKFVGAQLGRLPPPGSIEAGRTPNGSSSVCQAKDYLGKESDLSYAILMESLLVGANLTCIDFFSADLRRARLDLATLESAILIAADLSGASFEGANLRNAFLTGAYLKSVNFHNAEMPGAILSRAKQAEDAEDEAWTREVISQVHFDFADLEGATFANRDIAGVYFSGADLVRADFSGATFNTVAFSGARLDGTIFADAEFKAVEMSNVNLRSAVFRCHTLRFGELDLSHSYVGPVFPGEASLGEACLEEEACDAAECVRKLDATSKLVLEAEGSASPTLDGAALRNIDFRNWDESNQRFLMEAETLSARLEAAYGDITVELPAWVQRPGHWLAADDPELLLRCWQGWRKSRGMQEVPDSDPLRDLLPEIEPGKPRYPLIPWNGDEGHPDCPQVGAFDPAP